MSLRGIPVAGKAHASCRIANRQSPRRRREKANVSCQHGEQSGPYLLRDSAVPAMVKERRHSAPTGTLDTQRERLCTMETRLRGRLSQRHDTSKMELPSGLISDQRNEIEDKWISPCRHSRLLEPLVEQQGGSVHAACASGRPVVLWRRAGTHGPLNAKRLAQCLAGRFKIPTRWEEAVFDNGTTRRGNAAASGAPRESGDAAEARKRARAILSGRPVFRRPS